MDVRDHAFQTKVRETAVRFPWYAGLIGPVPDAGWRPEQLPLLTADILERYYYGGQTLPDPTWSVYSTSGTSSGRRKSIYYSVADERNYIEIKTKMYGDWLRNIPLKKALADMGTGHAAETALAVFERLGMEGAAISFQLPVERHIECLETFRPDLLYTMPSILDRIIQDAHDPSHFGIRKIILVGEIATPTWQRKAADLFGIRETDILDTYGSIEIGTIASYSYGLGRYVVTDGLYAEGVPAQQLGEGFEPLADNETVLVLTSYVREAFPSVRFVTYDVVRDFRTINIGGVPKHTFSSIVKRIGAELKHGEKISLYDIEEAVLRFADDADVRVKVRDNRLSVDIKSKTLNPAVIPAIRGAIEEKIPEIGVMIRNRILDGIVVRAVGEGEALERGKVKTKRIYY